MSSQILILTVSSNEISSITEKLEKKLLLRAIVRKSRRKIQSRRAHVEQANFLCHDCDTLIKDAPSSLNHLNSRNYADFYGHVTINFRKICMADFVGPQAK
uniref:Uncharacterized protein n=1 Tax=Rhizophagus irregularis (strain DAOM 181602 / DAOM 197198 / MUCL 43194) TaxID=747089 RepID=U9V7K3_RHIID